MKKLYLISILLFFSQLILCQISDEYWGKLVNDASSFYQVVDSFDVYLNSTYPDSIPSDKLSNIKDYYRFIRFWKSRLGEIDNETSYQPYQLAMLNSLTDPKCNSADPANWQLVGPVAYTSQTLGLVSQVLHDPDNSNSYLLSSDYGGLWKSHSTGNSWLNVTDPLRIPGLSSNEIIRNPKNHDHIIAATYGGLHSADYGIGIIESFDNGDSWQVMEGFPYENAPMVVKVLYNPYMSSGDDIALYAITKKEIYLSLNTGISWLQVSAPPISDYDDFVDIETSGFGVVFISTKYRYNDTEGKIFRFNNGVWENIMDNNSVIDSFQIASYTTPYNGKIFMHCYGKYGSDVYKTVNSGDTWEKLPVTLTSPKNEIEYSPESNIIYHGGVYLRYFKDDANYTVHTISSSAQMHVDIRDFDFIGIDENNKENILIATDGGVSLCKLNISNPNDYEMF